MTRLLAPIIPHTADELWDYRSASRRRNRPAFIWPSSPSLTHVGMISKRDDTQLGRDAQSFVSKS